ncbi:hypothetical protein A3H16_03730 [Candidatus Kaiserbacteria bacterium RIFCSPLOWO2_12_FULL_53_8]|uniref:Uncharacterized protein n=2 Tax=Candidatus Kaiseribacteriota TaxID=1752734 RepID=A0A1F6CWS8_9BACT|nr:MAG: hypothetical protein A2851_04245 [Candidatus Kaiserbacteria bacterium RIFCSPHIGHO2_01_FULL_53_29]OGG91100.1 MAG: hypothetical protein A3H16_03730 [Candidatus Kaiserbacteria bacterium RIFCSPLOWO2_12_FULL_53_8]
MRINTESQEILDYTHEISGIENRSLTDLVRVGDELFIGFQGGLIDYNLSTKTSKQYTTADGLASNSNIAFTPDPSDANTLWISTFEGLSKLAISSGHIQSFTSEMGIPGTKWQPRVFHVDDRYVWLTISANAYTTGGIARLDKKTGIWKDWGYELFHYGRTPSRFDTYGAAADGEQAVVEEDGIIYRYDSIKDEWLPVTTYRQGNPVKREITLKSNTAYFWSGTLKELNIDTGAEHDLLQPEMFADAGVSFEKFSNALLHTEFDKARNRLILYPKNVSLNTGIGILSLETKKLAIFPFKNFERSFALFNVNLADASGSHIILNTENGLVDYDWPKNTVRKLLPHGASVAKIVGNQVVALNLATCEMLCDLESLVATSSIISLDTAKIESVTTINGTTTDAYYIGDTVNDVYLFTYNYKETNKGYKLDTANNSFKPIDLTFTHSWIPEELYSSSGSHVSDSSGPYILSFDRHQVGDTITVTLQSSSREQNIKIPVGPEEYNHWSTNSDTQIASYTFDPSNPDIFWIGTDRGLVRLNVPTLEYRLYTTSGGLSSDAISKVIPTDNVVVVEHPSGVYVYQLAHFSSN